MLRAVALECIMTSRLILLTSCTVLVVACSDARLPSQPSTSAATAPATTSTITQAAAPPPSANWTGDATVLAVTGAGGCGWGITAGDTRRGVWWRITQQGTAITLDEDMSNWPTDDIPFSGSLDGARFTATDVEPGGGACMFRGGQLTGGFSDDGQTFDATETLTWGSSGGAVTVTRHWTGRRL